MPAYRTFLILTPMTRRCPSPRRTGRADFPHPALQKSVASWLCSPLSGQTVERDQS